MKNCLALLALLVLSGCNSIQSTMIERDESNQQWDRKGPLQGIPITLKVPTHLKLYVFDKHYLEVVDIDAAGKTQKVQPVALDIPLRDFAHEFMYTEKIFTVDFKRPAAGTSNLRLDMTEEQYFAKIQHDVADQTIEAVTGLLGSLFPKEGMLPSPRTTTTPSRKPNLKELKALVAVGVFEIEAPDFEQQVAGFLNCHVNKAHDAWVVPPCTGPFQRIPPQDHLEVSYPLVPLCTLEAGLPVSTPSPP
jgi:hypothetical protein